METLSIIITGLSAGIFFSWSITVIPGTKLISDSCYLETMKLINIRIKNPLFLVIFMGPIFLLAYQARSFDPLPVAALLIYLIGPLGITFTKNIPLNDKLDTKDLNSLSLADKKSFRQNYESKWNFWNYIRTVMSIISFILVAL